MCVFTANTVVRTRYDFVGRAILAWIPELAYVTNSHPSLNIFLVSLAALRWIMHSVWSFPLWNKHKRPRGHTTCRSGKGTFKKKLMLRRRNRTDLRAIANVVHE